MCTPALLAEKPVRRPRDLACHTLIHLGWPPDSHAPTWPHWLERARAIYPDVPELDLSRGIAFEEELHGIEAALAGQGIAICSDVRA